MKYLKSFVIYSFIALISLSFAVTGCGKKVEEKAGQKAPEKSAASSLEAPEKAYPEFISTGREVMLYGFEEDTGYWAIPDWSLETPDYVTKTIEVSKDYAREGSSSLKVMSDFPGKTWKASLVEQEDYMDWGPYCKISLDIYLPKDAPEGLKAKIILTVGENWKFTEMSRAVFLSPGKWNTVSASLLPGTDDWKMTVVDDDFRRDVRKMAIRIESNKGPVYAGPVYIDNIRGTE